MPIRSLLLAVALLVPVSASAQLPIADCAAFYDADDNRIGRVSANDSPGVYFDVGGSAIFLGVGGSNGFNISGTLFFTDASHPSSTARVWVDLTSESREH